MGGRGAFKGRSSSLRRAIKRCLGQAIKQSEMPNQAHHALSSSVILELDAKPEYGPKLAEKAGYNINNANNGILMPARYGHQKAMNLQRHEGGHSEAYYTKVRELIEPIWEDYKNLDHCKDPQGVTDLLADLADNENVAKTQISDIGWELYARSKELFTKDYKDEGQGDLSNKSRPNDPSRASGLGWIGFEAIGNNLRRRYEVKNGEKVVYAGFYDYYGYPSPGTNPRA